ncbi:unnamed protein product [Echinostoma caproni]|uniref:Uncharacterized protein n=1 Tax=Echinostoma caproni TaxID=27848 RepID=A0A183AGZ4_9TREM|nr:unnamed protein product [Echinostoma caproni]
MFPTPIDTPSVTRPLASSHELMRQLETREPVDSGVTSYEKAVSWGSAANSKNHDNDNDDDDDDSDDDDDGDDDDDDDGDDNDSDDDDDDDLDDDGVTP